MRPSITHQVSRILALPVLIKADVDRRLIKRENDAVCKRRAGSCPGNLGNLILIDPVWLMVRI